jgi:hypothetical protein
MKRRIGIGIREPGRRSADHLSVVVSFGGEDLFLVEGKLIEYQFARCPEGLREAIDQRGKGDELTPEVRSAVERVLDAVSQDGLRGLYESEYGYNFVGVLGDEVIYGTFDNAHGFAAGEVIKAVVSRRHGILYAHAMLRNEERLLGIDPRARIGPVAFRRHCVRRAWLWSSFGWLGALVFILFLLQGQGTLTQANLLAWLPVIVIVPPLLACFRQYNAYQEGLNGALHGAAIFRVFGFLHPDEAEL